jgi:hypothetical protein
VAFVDLSFDLAVVIFANGDNLGPVEYDIGVAQIDVAGFYFISREDPIGALDGV